MSCPNLAYYRTQRTLPVLVITNHTYYHMWAFIFLNNKSTFHAYKKKMKIHNWKCKSPFQASGAALISHSRCVSMCVCEYRSIMWLALIVASFISLSEEAGATDV